MANRAKALGIVIVGGNGFLGSHLARSLRKRARVVVTYAKNRVPLDGVLSLPIDIKNVTSIRRILFAQKPDIVIYLGGPEDGAWVDANPKLAEQIISSGTTEILHATEMMSARFLYVSSASVFDGTQGNYQESDHISPVTLLGKLKANGENIVRGRSQVASVLRLSPLVGMSHPWRPSLFDRIRHSLEFEKSFELYDDEYHSWASVSSAVEAIEAVIDRGAKNSFYHFGGLTRLTPLEMAQLFARTLGYDENRIQSVLVPKKRIPKKGVPNLHEGEKFDFSLNSTGIVRGLNASIYPIEEVLKKEFAL